jgi:signal transduction histidine kinase/ligand-binding sensor domain-containing protein
MRGGTASRHDCAAAIGKAAIHGMLADRSPRVYPTRGLSFGGWGGMRWLARMAMLAIVAWASPTAAEPSLPVMPGYKRTAFTLEEGAPSSVTSVAQTADGFLWMGTAQGLWRFDGVAFERMSALERTGGSGVRSLLATRRGELWIGYGFAGLARSRGSRVLPASPGEMPKGWTDSLSEAPDGAIWAVSSGSLYRHAGERWTRRKYAALGQPIHALAARDGSVWACLRKDDNRRLIRVDPVTMAPTVVAELGEACALSRDAEGGVLVADRKRIRRFEAGRPAGGTAAILPEGMPDPAIGVGRNGDVWVASHSRRILKITWPGSGRGAASEATVFESAPGDANYATSPFQDREGNWWVGTNRGIDRFHPVDVVHNSAIDPRLRALLPTESNAYQVLADGRRTIFLRVDRRFFRIADDGRAMPLPTASLGPGDTVCAARDAGLWVRTAPDTVRLVGGARTRSVRIPPADRPLAATSLCFEDRDGRLWLGMPSLGLVRYDRSDRNPQAMAFDDRPDAFPYMMTQGRDGVITYVGYGYTAAFDGRRFRTLIGYERNPFTFISAILQRPNGLLIGGESGLGMLRDGRLRMVPAGENGIFGDVSGLVQNKAGETWLQSQAGLVRLPSAALAARIGGRPRALASRIFDHDDGVTGRSAVRGFTDLVEAADGRLWFANETGIYSLDPRRIARNMLRPPVSVRAIAADGRPFVPARSLDLPAGTRSLRIDFTATSLGVPRRVSFRYRLDGVDADWVDPGARRQAIYTGLGPGRYRFQVIASNDDGVWNPTGAIMEIVVPPTFVESRWFVLLCVGAALAVGWLFYSLRIRRLNQRFDAMLRERLDERERIARDLHDTLLQGLQGLMLTFQAVANRLQAGSALRGTLDQALDRAEAVIVEGRDKVRDLRSETGDVPLEQRIREMLEIAAQDGVARTTLTVEGSTRPLSRRPAGEASAIAAEALRNAHRHAAARHVEIVVTYGLTALTLAIRDDGRGIDQDEAAAKRRDGHFGLVGMEERAARAGGTLRVSTRRGRGTEIVLTIPALVAYTRGRVARPGFWRSLRTVATHGAD